MTESTTELEGLRELLAKADVRPALYVDYVENGEGPEAKLLAFIMDGDGRYLLVDEEPNAIDGPPSPFAELVVAAVNALPFFIERAEAAERAEAENEQLKLAILGGEDVPGLAASIPVAEVIEIHRENRSAATARAEAAEARLSALSEALGKAKHGLNAASPIIEQLIQSEHNVELWGLRGRMAAIDAARAALQGAEMKEGGGE